MSIIEGIVIGVIILILLFIYYMLVKIYISTSKKYRTATKVTGTIVELLEVVKRRTNSRSMFSSSYSVSREYMVRFYVNGREHIEKVDLCNTKYQVGDCAEIRYNISKEGELVVESQGFLRWSRIMAIGSTIGLILGLGMGIYKLME